MTMFVLLGGGGHAAVVREIAILNGVKLQGYYDHRRTTLDLPWLGQLPLDSLPSDIEYVCCVGDNKTRKRIVEAYPATTWATLIHPRAIVATDAVIGVGSIICAGAVVEAGSNIGSHCIINSSVIVNHHSTIENYVHIAPGSNLCGNVYVGTGSLVGAGSQVLPGVRIGTNAVIGAGSTVLVNVGNDQTRHGVIKMKPVEWLPHKVPNYKRIEQLLEMSTSTNQYSNGGPAVRELEERLRSLLEVDNTRKSLIAVANGTLALSALVSGLRSYHAKQLKFATQSFTFPASVQGSLQGSVIVDIDAGGGLDLQLLDPTSVDGIVVTNCFGHVVDVAKYEEWCTTYQKFLLFDNAATALTRVKGINIVNYGVGCILSLHHTKPLGFGEGGIIIVDKVYEPAIRQIINFGYNVAKGDMIWQPEGSNYKMSDVAAAFINSYLDGFSKQYDKTIQLYREAEKLLKVRLFPNHSDDTPFTSCLPILISHSVTLEEIQRINCKYKVNVRKYYKSLNKASFSVAIWDRIVCFPLHRDMESDDLQIYQQIIEELEC